MAITLDVALSNVDQFIGKKCTIDNSVAKIDMLSDEVWSVVVFDWRTGNFAKRFPDEFGDYFPDWINEEDGREWINKDLIPFAFIGTSGGSPTKYPDQITGAILFFDLKNGKDGTCPVLVGWPDDFNLQKKFKNIAAIPLRIVDGSGKPKKK